MVVPSPAAVPAEQPGLSVHPPSRTRPGRCRARRAGPVPRRRRSRRIIGRCRSPQRRRHGPGSGSVPASTAVTADHGDHGRSRPATAVTAGRGRAFRTRGHGPGVTNQARTGRVRVRTAPSGHDLSPAITAVVTAAAAPPGSRPGAAPTRSSARMAGERRARAARRGPPRGREPRERMNMSEGMRSESPQPSQG